MSRKLREVGIVFILVVLQIVISNKVLLGAVGQNLSLLQKSTQVKSAVGLNRYFLWNTLIEKGELNHYIVSSYQLPMLFGQLEQRNIAADFAVVQGSIALLHACFMPMRVALERGSIYERKWETILPVFGTDILAGLLAGHLGGLVCRAWVNELEADIKAFFKSMVTGLFAGAIWGAATSVAWGIASRQFRQYQEAEDYNTHFYMSIGAGVVLSSVAHPIIVIWRY